MEEYRSHSEINKIANNPLQFSFLIVLLYLLASLFLLSLLNVRVIWSVVVNSYAGVGAQGGLTPFTDNLVSFMGRLNTPLLMAIWGFFGALVYSLIWVFQNILSTVEEEVEESQYLEGGKVPIAATSYWHNVLVSNLTVIGLAVLWVSYIAVFLSFLLPHASRLYYLAFYEPSTYIQILDIAGAALIGAASLYILRLIYFFLAASWRAARH